MMYVRFPLSLRSIEDLLFEHGIDICHETVRFWWNRFGPLFASEIRRRRETQFQGFRHWRWHLSFRRRELAMLRFRHMKTLQNFASIHASICNHFTSERHLVDRQTYKASRSAKLAEWQNLAA
jgi:transposase-like protein